MSHSAKRRKESVEHVDQNHYVEGSESADDDEYCEDFDLPLSQTDNAAPESQFVQHSSSGRQSAGSNASLEARRKTLKFITKEKRLHDRCHGQISLEPLLVRILDTREFQRLRTLKQLGGCAFVYPDASHSRFEHSIGVAFLSRRMVEHLQAAEQRHGLPEGHAPIDARDVTCVSLAGLVHDLGHGPFSHMFEEFVKQAREAAGETDHFEHEDMSVAILELLLEKNDISLQKYMGTTEAEAAADLAFVLNLISGLPPGVPVPPECGRPACKRFLFEIVANKRNGIDVDKIDYFLRDSSSAFGESSPLIEVTRIVESCGVKTLATGETSICFEEKMAMDLLGLFRTRMQLHSHLYQHHVVNVVEEMITDAFCAAAHVPIVRGSQTPETGKAYTLMEATRDVTAYVNLGDWVLDFIEASSDARFEKAQQVISRLRERNLYDQVGVPLTKRDPSMTKHYLVQEIVRECWRNHAASAAESSAPGAGAGASHAIISSSSRRESDPGPSCSQQSEQQASTQLSQAVSVSSSGSAPPPPLIKESDVVVLEMKISYGKDCVTGKPGYPLQHVFFFNPKDPEKAPFRIPEQRIGDLNLPKGWEEVKFWVYVRDPALWTTVDAAWTVVRSRLMKEARAMEGGVMQNSPAKLPRLPAYDSSPANTALSTSSRWANGGPSSEPWHGKRAAGNGGNSHHHHSTARRLAAPLELPLGPIGELTGEEGN